MNRARPGRYCFVCKFDMIAGRRPISNGVDWDAMQRQTHNGICDPCQRLRHAAAVEYDCAAYAVRLMRLLGAHHEHGPRHTPRNNTMFSRALDRMKYADERCVALKMWSATVADTERSKTA